MSLRIAFMGTPAFAVPALEALIHSPHQIVSVYTQPPRPAGRGHKVTKSPVHQLADSAGIAVSYPRSLKSPEVQADFASLTLDVAVVAAYGLILPQAILSLPKYGCINIHGSLLPRWRGAAPIQRAIEAGDSHTGITIMQMEAGLDTGPMLAKETVTIEQDSTALTVQDELAQLGARMIVPVLETVAAGTAQSQIQDAAEANYATKLTREDGRLEWTQDAAVLERKIRAFVPWPGCWFSLNGEVVKVGSAALVAANGTPGQLLDQAMTIACGTGALKLTRLQRPGRNWIDGATFMRSVPLSPGEVLA